VRKGERDKERTRERERERGIMYPCHCLCALGFVAMRVLRIACFALCVWYVIHNFFCV